MIIARAPLRISFVGGGTDLPDFYRRSPGRVISAAIDQYVYAVINYTPLVHKVTVRYSVAETVDHPSLLRHDRARAALLDLGIHSNTEIGFFAHLPARTGLGSSSSLAVSLVKGLAAYQGRKIDRREAAEAAARLEIELLGEPVGKQDQYAAAFGGLNVFQFNADESVEVEPVLIDYRRRLHLEEHLLLFFTGITRLASSVLTEQKANIAEKFGTLEAMADSVLEFRSRLVAGDFRGMGEMLHRGWEQKKTLASNVSNAIIDALYDAGMNAGAWGGKVLGAGGGGCIMFLVPIEHKPAIREAVAEAAARNNLEEFEEIPVRFVQSGAELVFNAGGIPQKMGSAAPLHLPPVEYGLERKT
ncbi:MAG: GHMP kinase [bacterium]|nr:GHMP kinase [bacterium]MDZ4296317.1 GHMP kinase [Patescibacteria group bacterium]